MSLKDTLKKQLTPELFTQVVDLLGDDFDYDMVPRTRLNKVIAQRNDLKNQLEGANHPNPDSEEGNPTGDSTNGGQQSFDGYVAQADVDKQLQALKDEHAKEIETMRKQGVVLDKLRSKGATDPDTILKAGLIKLDDLTFGEDGTLTGVDDVIKNLVKDKAYFFNASASHERGTGKQGTEGAEGASALDSQLNAIFGQYGVDSAES